MKHLLYMIVSCMLLLAFSCSQTSRLENSADFSQQDDIFIDEDNDDQDWDSLDGTEVDLLGGGSLPAGVKVATSLQAGLNWSRCESIVYNGPRYARLFGIVRTECSNSANCVVSQEVRVYYNIVGTTNWLKVNARYIGYSNNKKFKRFYFATGEIGYDSLMSKASPVVRYRICYVRNGVELWVNNFRDFYTTPDPEKAPLAKDGSRYTQSIPGIFHLVTENMIAYPVYNVSNKISGYKVSSHCLSKYVPAYQLRNGTNSKRVSFHSLSWPNNWSPTLGYNSTFYGGWNWGDAFRSDLTNRAYNYDASLSKYFKAFATNLGVFDPATMDRYYYKHYTNGYENFYLEYTYPPETRGIQFIFWSECWNQAGTRIQYHDKHRCRRYWLAMPTNGGTNVMRFSYNYNFSEYIKSTGPVVAAVIPQ